MTEWRDIGSAPKDGTAILCYFPLAGLSEDWHRIVPVRYVGDRWDFAGRAASGFSRDYRPSHWMPLPAPPAHEGE